MTSALRKLERSLESGEALSYQSAPSVSLLPLLPTFGLTSQRRARLDAPNVFFQNGLSRSYLLAK